MRVRLVVVVVVDPYSARRRSRRRMPVVFCGVPVNARSFRLQLEVKEESWGFVSVCAEVEIPCGKSLWGH